MGDANPNALLVAVDDASLIAARRVALLEAQRQGLNDADADDCAQEVCVQAWAALAKGTAIKSIGAWSRIAARRLILNAHRDAQRHKRGGGLVESLDAILAANPDAV